MARLRAIFLVSGINEDQVQLLPKKSSSKGEALKRERFPPFNGRTL
jgi:hypothetical protein